MYCCRECGAKATRWEGRCARCGAWGTLEDENPPDVPAGPVPLREVSNDEAKRRPTGIGELDRVLGGGAVPGSVVLVGGEPGVGKSTLLLGFAARAGPQALYVAGEESPAQVAQRARRLGLGDSRLALLDETDTDRIASEIESRRPAFAVVDSVQSLHAAAIDGITGGPAQVRGAAERLVPVARASGCALFLVGQVTKEGGIAGPRTLEHAVDAVLYFEGERHMSMRALRAVKNRFGPCDEVGLFEMKEEGLAELRDAQALLTPTREVPRAGAVVGVALEGRRALCLEVEALAVGDNISMPRRRGQGLDPRRLEVLAGCLSSHIAESLSKSDLYVNVVGGLTVRDPGLDAAVAVAIHGAVSQKPFPAEAVAIGEVSLLGELRPTPQMTARLKEARAMGFRAAFVPPHTPPLDGLELVPVPFIGAVLGTHGLEEAQV